MRNRIAAALLAPLGLFLAANAQAQCAEPYNTDGLLGDLGTIEGALRSGDDAAASAGANKMEAGLACMNEVLPVMIVGRAYRAIGAGKIAGGDTDRGMEWFRTATEVEQAFDYGLEDLPADHPVRMYYSDAKIQASGEVVVMEDMSFMDGTHWVDGRTIDVPKARLDRPHLYQLEGGGQVMSWVITGNGFPPDVLKAGLDDAIADADEGDGTDEALVVGKAPKEKKNKKDKPDKVAKDKSDKEKKGKTLQPTASSDGTVVIKRQRPWEKTPLMVGGGAIIAGAAGLYAAAASSRSAFDNAETLEDIERLQTTTNQLVIISAATAAVGAGTLTWGVILDGGGTPVPSVRFRF